MTLCTTVWHKIAQPEQLPTHLGKKQIRKDAGGTKSDEFDLHLHYLPEIPYIINAFTFPLLIHN